MEKPDIFISYSHRDEKYKDELLRHLSLIERQGLANFWDTRQIQPGDEWDKEIKKAISQAEIAILLISADYLASDYIQDSELPLLLERAKLGSTIILPILVTSTRWTAVPELAQFQFLNDVRLPLSQSQDRDKVYVSIAQKIYDIVLATNERSESKTKAPTKAAQKRIQVFLSHSKYDGDFAELMKLRLEKEGIIAWIDTDRLEPGVDWRQEIDQSIKDSESLIVVMSPEARESEYVTYEWAFGYGNGVNLIPLMLRDTPLHPRLAALQYLDFTNRRARPWDKLIQAIRDKVKD